MATCKRCGNKYSALAALLGATLCNTCFKSDQQARAEAEKNAPEEAKRQLQAELAATYCTDEEPAFSSSNIAEKLSRRYLNAYTEAHTVVGVGKIIKGIGVVLAVIIFIGGVVMTSNSGIGFVLACLVGIPTYVLGILVAAHGQTQLATLDTAVNSSRHLRDDDVAKILSKRFSL